MTDRRQHLFQLAGVTAWFTGLTVFGAHAATPGGTGKVYTVAYPDAEWKKRLSNDQYLVLRQAGTETPYTSPLLKEKRTGSYACAGCAQPLFSSKVKYDSNTGWPSFWQAMDKAVDEAPDTSLPGTPRTEALCSRCGGHLGHVFNDGPQPTGLRYCMNGLALNFMAA